MMKHVIDSIVQLHAEEAAFLWLLRNNAILAPHYALNDLAKLDDRVEAHLGGLRIAGDAGWKVCKEGLGQKAADEVFAAAFVLSHTSVTAKGGGSASLENGGSRGQW